MAAKKIFRAAFLLFCILILAVWPSYGGHPSYYKEKRIFYDSLSLVLNKYIIPVGNWGLFVGTLHGLESFFHDEHLQVIAEGGRIELRAGESPPLFFSRNEIDTNALEMVDSLSMVFDSVFARYPGVDKNWIINAAITGMVSTLEPNSYFIEPQALQRIQAQNRGFFNGIGLEITDRDDLVTIVSPYENTPAFRAGLLPYDRIVAVDGMPTKGKRIMEVSERIRGEKGKPVTLTIQRSGWEAPRDFVLVRDTISHRTVTFKRLEPGFGYIRIINFLGSTDDDFNAALTSLANDSQLKGLIIDLRYNPGGLLGQSLGITDFFLDAGVIATTDSRIKSDNKTYYARPATLPSDFPIVILINGGSASGSEIVAASLRDHQRAVLIGERTFGKGYIQTVFQVQTGGAIRLTTSMLLTPGGKTIQDIGIEPDVHLSSMMPAAEQPEENRQPLPTPPGTETAGNDPAIRLGLDILKRSLLLQDTPEDELKGLSPEQAGVIKRFNGLQKAVEELNNPEKAQDT